MNRQNGEFLDCKLFHPKELALLEGLELFKLQGEDCPYFDDGRIRESLNFISRDMDTFSYEALLAFGWRRCGCLFYKSLCRDCELCHPIRVDSSFFSPDRSQRRCYALNKDMSVAVGDPGDIDEDYELFSRYCFMRHGEKRQTREEFRLFLANPPLPSVVIRHRNSEGRLFLNFEDRGIIFNGVWL